MRMKMLMGCCPEPEQPNPRYTQLPSYELNRRRPVLDGSPEDSPRVLRAATLKDGVSFCEPIERDWV